MTTETFAALIRAESAKATTALTQARQALRQRDAAALERHLRAYVLHKFLLADTKVQGDNLLELAHESTRHILLLTGGDLKAADISIGCAGADTPTTKKILLLLALREAFALPFDPERSADIETVRDLCEVFLACQDELSPMEN